MRAIRFHELGGQEVLRLDDIPTPEPGPGQVLIEVHAAGINYADTRRRLGIYLEPSPLPFILGSEVAGTVAALGAGVTTWKVGDRVMALTSHGGYAEYVATPATSIMPLPESLSYVEGAAFPVQAMTAYHLLKTSGRMVAGESVLVHSAAGGVGTLAVQLARLFGADTIYATGSTQQKLDLARSLGADVTINYTTENFAERIAEHSKAQGKRGVDVILEAVGGQVFERSLTCLATFGRLVVYGLASNEPHQVSPVRLMKRCQEIIGFYLPPILERADLFGPSIQALTGALASGHFKLIVGETHPLEAVAEAHRRLEARQTTGKVVLRVRE